MTSPFRLAACCLAALAVAVPSAAAHRAAVAAPAGLHGFVLRADEAPSSSFSRTPSFGWRPVRGASRYELQLSTSDAFRESGIVYDDATLTGPVAAPSLTLPWITGSPHALYVRVRGILRGTTTPWSSSVGFDVTPPPPPTPLRTYPGLLRWTPIEGAEAYEVWLLDPNRRVRVFTNVLDEREAYTFHRDSSWSGTVHWRVRALRITNLAQGSGGQQGNGLPAVGYGAWSPVYTASNPPAASGPIRLLGTVSDAFSDGGGDSPAHASMPAFLFDGDQGLGGISTGLFRVYVSTDRQCLNTVFTGAVVGSPAYSPRPYGPLALPTSTAALALAASQYAQTGTAEGPSFSADGDDVTTSESLPPATPTSSLPAVAGAAPAPAAPAPTPAPAQGAPSTPAPAGPGTLDWGSTSFGAPVDLWDTSWPQGGYYWTVVPVAPVVVAPTSADQGQSGQNQTQGGNVEYRDLELPQDACAAGRVLRFGKSSRPAVTAAGDAFASGLSPAGRLVSARRTPSFYGSPLVAWRPALGATAYQVQWSPRAYPFVAQPVPATNAAGLITSATAAVLPLAPGTWYYRVRGFDYSLPTGAQAMSWSAPTKLVVTKPRFAVVGR